MSRSRHEEYRKYLAEFSMSELDPALMAEVGAHVATCRICRDWLASHHLIGSALTSGRRVRPENHPTSEELVRFALKPRALGLGGSALGPVATHVRDCPRCAVEMDLCRGAVGVGRMTRGPWHFEMRARVRRLSPDLSVSPRPRSGGRRGRERALQVVAAAVVVLGMVAAILFSVRFRPIPANVVLTGRTFRGHQTIEATDSIELSRSRVDLDATITLRAARVALGDGFSLGKGAKLTIEAPAATRKR